jgi:hypothetical protein
MWFMQYVSFLCIEGECAFSFNDIHYEKIWTYEWIKYKPLIFFHNYILNLKH